MTHVTKSWICFWTCQKGEVQKSQKSRKFILFYQKKNPKYFELSQRWIALHASASPGRLVFGTGSSRNCGAMEPFRAHPLHTLVRSQKLQTSPKLHPVCVHIFVYLFMFLNLFSLLLAKLPFLKAQPDGTDTAKSRPFTHVTTTSQAGLQLVVATTTEHRTSSVFGLQRIDSSTDPVGIRGRSRWHNDSWRVNGLCQVVDLRNCPQRIVCRVS